MTPEQVEAIERVYQQMRKEAIDEGERLISREQALEGAFSNRAVTEGTLRDMLEVIEESRSNLRYIHLAAHLRTLEILTDDQIARYNTLRGYGTDPCSEAPAGHNPTMWRKHNGCE